MHQAEAARRTNLPARRTALIGRDEDLAAVREHVLHAEGRLVTLTGAGGSGKTVLALEVGRRLLDAFDDGVWLAELAPLADPALVTQAVAAPFGVREGSERPLLDGLIAYLESRALLLLLDNCEHLVDAAAALLDALLGRCPELRVLATSREPLRVAGERIWRVPSLAVPDPRRLLPLDELGAVPAVRLFMERAQAAQPSFRLTPQHAPAVAEVCSRLDGIPLALELAASRVQALAVETLAARLEHSFQLLTGGSRTAPSRHQTLKATLDWSYNLLPEAEQALLRRLAVFAGGFELEAAEAVGGADEAEAAEVLELLSRLVTKSLVIAEERDGGARFRLLEPIRQYSRDLLGTAGEASAVRERHADYCLALAERIRMALWGIHLFGPFGQPEQVALFARLEREHDNLRAALAWVEERGGVEVLARLIASLYLFWILQGHVAEGWRWAEASLASGADLPAPLRAGLLGAVGILTHARGDHAAAASLIAESHSLFRALGDDWHAGLMLNMWGVDVGHGGDVVTARRLLEESLAVYRRLGDDWGIGFALQDLGETVWQAGELGEARALLEEALPPLRRSGEVWLVADTLIELGALALGAGEVERAGRHAHEGLAQLRDAGLRWFLPEGLELAAGVAAARGRSEAAARLLGAADAARELTGAARYPTLEALHGRTLQRVRAALPAAALAALWDEGRRLTADAAIDSALEGGECDAASQAQRPTASSPLDPLTAREREVALLIARGRTNRQIAEELVIAEGTVANHVGHVLGKLECATRAQVAALLGARGLLAEPPR